MANDLIIQLTLIKVIHEEANVKKLQFLGLSYSEIAILIDSNIKDGYLNDIEGELHVTEKGVELLLQKKHLLKENDKSKWIEIDHKNKMKKIGKDDVFLPSKKELSFLKKLP